MMFLAFTIEKLHDISDMNFLRDIKQSIYNRAYYKAIPNKSLGNAVSYFFLLIFVLTIIQTIFLAIPLYNGTNIFLDQGVKIVLTNYPKDLRVQIQNGKVTTNVTEPYFISMPEGFEDKSTQYTHLLVIDTKTAFSQKQFTAYNAAVWLTGDSLFYKEKNGQLRGTDLSNIHDLTVDQSTLQQISKKISPWLHFVAPLLVVVTLIGVFLGYLFNFVYMLFLALVLLLVGKIISVKLTYGQAYKVCLHAITLGLLIAVVLNATEFFFHIRAFPFMITLISIGVFFVNFSKPSQAKKQTK